MIRGGYWKKGEISPFFPTLIKMQTKLDLQQYLKKTICRAIRFVLFRNRVIFCVFLFMKEKIGTALPGYHFRAIPLFFLMIFYLFSRVTIFEAPPGSTRDMQFLLTWFHERYTIFEVPREACNFFSPGSTRDMQFLLSWFHKRFQFSRPHERYTIFALLVPREIHNFRPDGSTGYIQFLLTWFHEKYTIFAPIGPREIYNCGSPGSTRDNNFRGPSRDIRFLPSWSHERYVGST